MPEAALLAGLVKSPSSYAPTVSMERAVARRNVVLQAMLENGAIDRTDVAVGARRQSSRSTTRCARTSRTASTSRSRSGASSSTASAGSASTRADCACSRRSTCRCSIAAEAAVAESAVEDSSDGARQARAARRRGRSATAPPPATPMPLQAALVALDPATGHVRAMVGGRDFDASHFNRAVQAQRQPGSAFKPFVYAAALEAGYTPATRASTTWTIRSRRCRAHGRRKTSTRPRRR